MPIRQITIIGTGLIGGSLGLALKKRGFRGRIIGCDHAPVLEQARKRGAIDDGRVHPAEAARGSQVVVLATPVGSIIDLIERLGPALAEKSLLTDVGSTKVEILKQRRRPLAKARIAFSCRTSHGRKGTARRGVRRPRSVSGCGLVVHARCPARKSTKAWRASFWNGSRSSARASPPWTPTSTTHSAPGSATCRR